MYVYLIETEAVHSSAFPVKYGVLMLLRELDEVGQLFYEGDLLTASGGVAGRHKFGWKI